MRDKGKLIAFSTILINRTSPKKRNRAWYLSTRKDVLVAVHPIGGEQERDSLGTSDKHEAIRAADLQRWKPLSSKGKNGAWNKKVTAYIKAGRVGERPRFRKNTAAAVKYAVKSFQSWSGVNDHYEVTSAILQKYYDIHSGHLAPEKTEKTPDFVNIATAQGYVSFHKAKAQIRDLSKGFYFGEGMLRDERGSLALYVTPRIHRERDGDKYQKDQIAFSRLSFHPKIRMWCRTASVSNKCPDCAPFSRFC